MPRFSIPIKDEHGRVIGIACGSRRRRNCATCKADAGLECDGCDKPLCSECAVSPKRGLDFCPRCFEPAWKYWLTLKPDAASKSQRVRRSGFRCWAALNPKFLDLVPLGQTAKDNLRSAEALAAGHDPRSLWMQAGGRVNADGSVTEADNEKYIELMMQHGHMTPRRK